MAADRNGRDVQARPAVFVGPHQLLRPLGEGGMGEVYLARSPGLRLLAVKVIRPEFADDPQFQQRFQQEVEAARRVTGFHTPPVVDAEPRGRRPWLATSYLPAPTLSEVITRFGVLGEAGARALGAGLAEALVAIHAAGVVHRDLKPGNVLIARDGPRVIDFGISRAFDAVHLTRTGTVCGTPGYIAPERIVSASVAYAAADVFSLGCLLVYVLTGRTPFGGGEPAQINRRVVYEEPDLSGVPAALRPLVAACLDKDPARRPTPAVLLGALAPAGPEMFLTPGLLADLDARERQAAIDLAAPPADPPALPVRTWQSLTRRGLFGLGAGLGAGAVVAAGVPLLLTRRAQIAGNTATVGKPTNAWGAAATVPDPLPAAPSPLWTGQDSGLMMAQLSVLGSTPVRWAEGQGARGFDGSTGHQLWSQPSVQFFQAQNGLLYGTSMDFGSLVWLDATAATHSSPLPVPASQRTAAAISLRVFGADSRTVVLAYQTSVTGGGVVMGTDQSSGQVLWQHEVTQSMAVSTARHMETELSGSGSSMGLVADGRCYYQDSDVLYAVDLRTGASLWQATGLAPGTNALPSRLLRAGELLLVVNGQAVVALDAATGQQRWTAPTVPQTVFGCALGTDRLLLCGALDTVYCLDITTGKGLWHTTVAVATGTSTGFRAPSAGDGFFAVPMVNQPSGVVVLDAADGTIHWAAHGTSDEGQWTTAAAGGTLYCVSATTLHAFRAAGA
ncbi:MULTISPECIES: protein kinase [unclassified Kitasatospora]|uniref:serine/threonine-protein kinase n=1 Tax=unclassified Kitasatospora TaxID=2633591 RepID=UPI0033C27D7C